MMNFRQNEEIYPQNNFLAKMKESETNLKVQCHTDYDFPPKNIIPDCNLDVCGWKNSLIFIGIIAEQKHSSEKKEILHFIKIDTWV